MQTIPISDVRALFAQMHAAVDAGDYNRAHKLTDAMEVLAMSYMEPTVDSDIVGFGFTRLEARMFARMKKDLGKCVPFHALLEAMYFDRGDDMGESNIINVIICHLRHAIRGKGYEIRNQWGMGYALHKVAA